MEATINLMRKSSTDQSKDSPPVPSTQSAKKLPQLSTKKAITSDVAPWMNASASDLNSIPEVDQIENSHSASITFEEKKRRLEAVSPWMVDEQTSDSFSRVSPQSFPIRGELRRDNLRHSRASSNGDSHKVRSPTTSVGSPWLAGIHIFSITNFKIISI